MNEGWRKKRGRRISQDNHVMKPIPKMKDVSEVERVKDIPCPDPDLHATELALANPGQ